MAKFNLNALLNSVSSENIADKAEKYQIEYISIYDLEQSEKNFYKIDDIKDLKASIEIAGGVKQNLIVKAIGNGKYKIIAGHRRMLSCKALVEEGQKQFEKVPCYVIRESDTVKEELLLLFTNSTTRELTDYEKVTQAKRLAELLTDLKKRENISGRVRELVADILKTTPSQIGRYESINKNLTEQLKEEFKNNNINVSVAYEASTLTEEKQEEVFNKVKGEGNISIKDVKQIKAVKEEKPNEEIEEVNNIEYAVYEKQEDNNIQTAKNINNFERIKEINSLEELATFIYSSNITNMPYNELVVWLKSNITNWVYYKRNKEHEEIDGQMYFKQKEM